MRKQRNFLLLVLFVFFSFSCKEEKKSCDFVILYTTDVHGNVLPYDFNKNRPNEASLANASSLINELDEQYGKNLLLFDGGDFIQGTPSMYYYNYYSTKEKHLISRVSNYLKYKMLVYGNHDLETGEESVNKFTRELNMARAGANIIDSRTGRGMYRPYRVFEVDGFRVAVLGLITPETYHQIPNSLVPHMLFDRMLDHAKKWVKEIVDFENADYVVCIAHAGIKDFEILDENNEPIHDGVKLIADSVPGIDLLLFGHDHGVYDDIMVNAWSDTVRVFQPAAYGEEIGRINVHISRNKDKTLTKTTETERIPLKNLPIDTAYVAEFQSVIDTVNKFLDRPMGFLGADLDMIGTLYKQTNTMDFIHGIQLMYTEADVSLSSALSTFRDLPEGPLTARTLFSLYKYDNQLHKIWMRGSEIKEFLEYGYARQFGVMKSENDHLIAFKYDKNGNIPVGRFGPELVVPQYNYTSAAGINYEVDVTRPLGNRVRIISMADGSPFDLNRQYTVAISSYQAAGGGGFVNRGLGWSQDDIAYHTLSISSKTITKIIADYLTESQVLDPSLFSETVGHWKVIPEAWVDSAGAKDARMLLPYIAK